MEEQQYNYAMDLELDKFQLVQVSAKAKGGKVKMEWCEHLLHENTERAESCSRETYRSVNEELFELMDKFKPLVPIPKNAPLDTDVEIIKVVFHADISAERKEYDIDIHYKINIYGTEGSPQATGKQKIQNVCELVGMDSKYLSDLIVDIEYNVYCFCILKQLFISEGDSVNIEGDDVKF